MRQHRRVDDNAARCVMGAAQQAMGQGDTTWVRRPEVRRLSVPEAGMALTIDGPGKTPLGLAADDAALTPVTGSGRPNEGATFVFTLPRGMEG